MEIARNPQLALTTNLTTFEALNSYQHLHSTDEETETERLGFVPRGQSLGSRLPVPTAVNPGACEHQSRLTRNPSFWAPGRK